MTVPDVERHDREEGGAEEGRRPGRGDPAEQRVEHRHGRGAEQGADAPVREDETRRPRCPARGPVGCSGPARRPRRRDLRRSTRPDPGSASSSGHDPQHRVLVRVQVDPSGQAPPKPVDPQDQRAQERDDEPPPLSPGPGAEAPARLRAAAVHAREHVRPATEGQASRETSITSVGAVAAPSPLPGFAESSLRPVAATLGRGRVLQP